MSAYYNEIDPYAAQWLRNLIAAGLIASGDVDERSIAEIDSADIDGYGQCHFFAGIGGWSYALRLAGWPDDRTVWTGSCPCQPLSSAGQRKGHADERHLWPAFYRLIAERRPATVFGEQVAGALGREWLSGVRADLEDAGYAVGAADLCAAGVGAPHIRQRLFWVADAGRASGGAEQLDEPWSKVGRHAPPTDPAGPRERGATVGLAISAKPRRGAQPQRADKPDGRAAQEPRRLCGAGGLGNAYQDGRRAAGERLSEPGERDAQPYGRLGNASASGLPAPQPEDLCGAGRGREGRAAPEPSPPRNFWSNAVWLQCLDGKSRRVEPGIFPLADRLPARVGKLRAAGNAIVPEVAAEFVAAFRECSP